MELETIKRAKQGYANEIGKIILENMQTLYRVAFSILRTEDEINDAISNTTVIVFEKIHTLKNEEYFKTWLTRVDDEIKNLVRKLDKDLKQIVILYYFEDFSVKEISKIIKIPEETVKSRLSRARKELEKALIAQENSERRNLNG